MTEGYSQEADPLRDLIDAERASEGAAARSARYWNSQAETESMTLRGRLGAAVESGEKVRMTLRNGSVYRGRIVAVGADVVAINTTEGAITLIASQQVASVRSHARELVTDEATPSSVTMHERIMALAASRAAVRVVLASGSDETGTMVACGADVCVIRNQARELSYVALNAVSEIIVSS